MSHKDRLIRQWIESGDLPPEALPGGFIPGRAGHETGGAGIGMVMPGGFAPEMEATGVPYGVGEPADGRPARRTDRRSSRALPLLVGLGVIVWAALAGAILYMKYASVQLVGGIALPLRM